MKRVKCVDCTFFRLDDELIPYCLYENECNIENPEDDDYLENRPCFNKCYESLNNNMEVL